MKHHETYYKYDDKNNNNDHMKRTLALFLIIIFIFTLFIPYAGAEIARTDNGDYPRIKFFLPDTRVAANANLSVSDGVSSFEWENVDSTALNASLGLGDDQTWTVDYGTGGRSYKFDLRMQPDPAVAKTYEVFLQDIMSLKKDEVVVLMQDDDSDPILNVTSSNELIEVELGGELRDFLGMAVMVDTDLGKGPVRGVDSVEVNGAARSSIDIGVARSGDVSGAFLFIPLMDDDVRTGAKVNIIFDTVLGSSSAVSIRRGLDNGMITEAGLTGDELKSSGLLFPQFIFDRGVVNATIKFEDVSYDLTVDAVQKEHIVIDTFAVSDTTRPSVHLIAEDSFTVAVVSTVNADDESMTIVSDIDSSRTGTGWLWFVGPENMMINEINIDGAAAPETQFRIDPGLDRGVVSLETPANLELVYGINWAFDIIGTDVMTAWPGMTTLLGLTLENSGSVDDTLSFSIDSDLPGTISIPDDVTLAAGELWLIDLDIFINADAAAGEYPVTLIGKGTGDNYVYHLIPITVDIPVVYDYIIQDLDTVGVAEGNQVEINVGVTNKGSTELTLGIEVTTDHSADVSYPEELLIDKGGTGILSVTFFVPNGTAGEYIMTVTFTGPLGRTDDEVFELIIETEDGGAIGKTPAPGPVVPTYAVTAAVAFPLIALLGFLFTEAGRFSVFKFLMLFIPLYSKMTREQVLDNFIRGKLYRYIEANPGQHYSKIGKIMKLNNGVLAYHLKTLEREDYIISKLDGHLRRFYPSKMKIPSKEIEELSWFQIGIIDVIRKNPGIHQKDIATATGESKQVVNYHINILVEANIIKRNRKGRRTEYTVDEDEIRMLPSMNGAKEKGSRPSAIDLARSEPAGHK